jgi:hypothetical protein
MNFKDKVAMAGLMLIIIGLPLAFVIFACVRDSLALH